MAGPIALRMLPIRSSSSALRAATTAPRLAIRRSYATKQAGPTAQFYKTFTRPVAKVLVLAVFTYQVVYWTWTKLEADELREETDATIADLEATVKEYQASKEASKSS